MRNKVDRKRRTRRLLTVTLVWAFVLSPIRVGLPHRSGVSEFAASGQSGSNAVQINQSTADSDMRSQFQPLKDQSALMNRIETGIEVAHAMDKREI